MTGAILASLIARSPRRDILVDRSLFGAVTMSSAQTLRTRGGDPTPEAVYVFGATVVAVGDMHPSSRAAPQGIWNY